MLENKVIPSDVIDLGLPSGRLWCSHNVGATTETDYGLYFSWGNIEGHEQGSGYDFSGSVYFSTPGISLISNINKCSTIYDAATVNMGKEWRMPTKDEFQELYDNTDVEWVTINGISGRKFMKKSDNSVYVFFPAAGFYYGTLLSTLGSYGNYWSSSFYDSFGAYDMYFSSSYVDPQNDYDRSVGFSVRAVYATN